MNIFKRPYTVRRYGKVDWNDEDLTEEYSDMQLMLDVQAKTRTNGDAVEGQSMQAKLTVYSDVELFPAEPGQQSSGDRLFYMALVRLQIGGLLGQYHAEALDRRV